MSSLSPVQQHLASALNFEGSCTAGKGALQKVHKFGHEWIEPREKFAIAGYEAQIGVIHAFASAIFHSMWSMTAGKFFTDKEARTFTVQSWKDLGNNLVCALKALIGVISPTAADWADKKMMTVRPKNEDEAAQIEEEAFSDDDEDVDSTDELPDQ